jgi:hypothetical protein
LSVALFYGIFAFLPVSNSHPQKLLVYDGAAILSIALLSITSRAGWCWQGRLGFLPALVVWAVAATASTIVNVGNGIVFQDYFGAYLAMPVIYLAIRCYAPRNDEWNTAILIFSIATMFPLLVGLRAFYRAFGTPDFTTLLNARFLKELDPYRDATWGNVTNTVAFLGQVVPIFLALAVDRATLGSRRIWYCGCLLIGLANVAIVSCRSYFLVLPVHALATLGMLRHRLSKQVAVFMLTPLAWGIFVLFAADGSTLWNRLLMATSTDSGDYSVGERLAAIQEGWQVFLENALAGIGPGCAAKGISYTSAHQLFVQQAVELGILGMGVTIVLFGQVAWRVLSLLIVRHSQRDEWYEFVAVISAFSFLAIGVLANVPMYLGPWPITLAAMLALADASADRRATRSKRNSRSGARVPLHRSAVRPAGTLPSIRSKSKINSVL